MEYSVLPVKSQLEEAGRQELEGFFLAAEVTEGADVGDDEGGGEAVFGADLAEVDAAIFDGEAAAVAVVVDWTIWVCRVLSVKRT